MYLLQKVVSIARDEASDYRQNYGTDVPLKVGKLLQYRTFVITLKRCF